nr:MAG TPA: hypothetical protein [Bacteriophage sp.]
MMIQPLQRFHLSQQGMIKGTSNVPDGLLHHAEQH